MRRSYQGELCTVRYQGTLPVWKENALGVEWDDPARGKHDGVLNGHKYFSPSVAGSGSFIKASKQPDQPKTFAQAFNQKYTDEFKWDEIALSRAKTITTFGAEKMQKRFSHRELLHSVSLSRQCVAEFDSISLPSLESLDLSYNLVYDLASVFEFCSQFKLTTLDLSGNRFGPITSLPTLEHLEELNLRSTLLSCRDIETIATACPRLKRLGAAYNRLDQAPQVHVEWLDLGYNYLTSIPLENKNIVLVANRIEKIKSAVRLQSLNLMDQATVLEWTDIDQLQVVDLWLSETLSRRTEIIGRLPRLEWLNGVQISSEERRDCETWVVARIRQGHLPDVPPSVHDYLASRHGQFSYGDSLHSIAARLMQVSINGRPFEIVKDAPLQRLLNMARRRLACKELVLPGAVLDWSDQVGNQLRPGDALQAVGSLAGSLESAEPAG